MIPPKVEESLQTLTQSLRGQKISAERLIEHWSTRARDASAVLDAEHRVAADHLESNLPGLTRSKNGSARLCELFNTQLGETLLAWCASSVERADVKIAPLLTAALNSATWSKQAEAIARQRIVQGPLEDALSCAPLLGTGDRLSRPENTEAQTRLEILFWEAGASSLQMPELGAWIFGSDLTFDALVATPATGSLRGRVLAARCLELCALGLPSTSNPQMLGRVLQVLQPLVLHPEPLVSLHAARALGLIATTTDVLEGMLLDWIGGESLVLRKRAITAATVLPSHKMATVRQHLVAALADPTAAAWVLPAAAASTPYLYKNNREQWDALFEKVISGAGGPTAALELAKGIGALWRRETNRQELEKPWSELRTLARRAKKLTTEDFRTYLSIIAITDPVDGAERDPLDLELGLENLVHLAAQYDYEEADARAARFAASLGRTFQEAWELALSKASLRHRAAGMNALEGCARSMALRLWKPQLETHPRGEPIPEPDLSSAWDMMAKAPIGPQPVTSTFLPSSGPARTMPCSATESGSAIAPSPSLTWSASRWAW